MFRQTFIISCIACLVIPLLYVGSAALIQPAIGRQAGTGEKLRIGIGGILHESNSFNPYKTTLSNFKDKYFFNYWVTGEEIIRQFQHASNHTGGALQYLQARSDVEIIPLVCASTTPGGVITDAAYERLLGDMLAAIREAGHLDGLIFANHGAMVTESILDADGYMLESVRKLVGPDVPIAAALDFHANCSNKVFDNTDIVVIFKRYPHIDRKETGSKAAELLYRMMSGEIHPRMAYIKVPLMPGLLKQLTEQEPMKSVNDLVYATEEEPGVLSCSLAGGYPYADVPQASSTIAVITDGDLKLAESHARRVAEYYWSRHREFKNDLLSAEEAMAAAAREKDGPVIMVDTGDNIGGGTPADGTMILRLLHERNMAGVVIINDPAAVEACIAAGVGSEVTVSVGGKLLTEQGGPVEVHGRVRMLFEGRYFRTGLPEQGLTEAIHPMALLIANKLKIILTNHRMIPKHLSQLRAVGITPEEEKLIVVKAAVAWREFYEPIAKKVFLVATPGYTSLNPDHFEFHHITRPLYPLDEDVTWQ